MRVSLLPAVFLVCLAFPPMTAHAASGDFAAAHALFGARRYPEARIALEKILAAEPRHAAACHYLGRAIAARNDAIALDEALPWLAKAVELEPKNAIYLGIYGGILLQQAGRTASYSAATKGREAMEKAIALDPDYLDAREGLFQFYQRAPWPVGSSAKANAQLEEIRQRDPARAIILSVLLKVNAKDYAAAFKLCEEALARNPADYVALYHFGRTASISGANLTRGLASLHACLKLEPPTPASPTHSNAWQRIGNIEERLQRPAEARAAYEAALKLDASNRQAADALAKLK